MSYEAIAKKYETLTAEQQMIVYNLIISLGKLNAKQAKSTPQKRVFGQFAGRATATFSDNWSMSEEELCGSCTI